MTGHKKLQDFMVDAKVPEPWRDRVPLLVAGRGIAWVAGWRIAEWARVGPDDRQVVEITLRNIG
jgi:tRNA(Ile)-lysidine synthase